MQWKTLSGFEKLLLIGGVVGIYLVFHFVEFLHYRRPDPTEASRLEAEAFQIYEKTLRNLTTSATCTQKRPEECKAQWTTLRRAVYAENHSLAFKSKMASTNLLYQKALMDRENSGFGQTEGHFGQVELIVESIEDFQRSVNQLRQGKDPQEKVAVRMAEKACDTLVETLLRERDAAKRFEELSLSSNKISRAKSAETAVQIRNHVNESRLKHATVCPSLPTLVEELKSISSTESK